MSRDGVKVKRLKAGEEGGGFKTRLCEFSTAQFIFACDGVMSSGLRSL